MLLFLPETGLSINHVSVHWEGLLLKSSKLALRPVSRAMRFALSFVSFHCKKCRHCILLSALHPSSLSSYRLARFGIERYKYFSLGSRSE